MITVNYVAIKVTLCGHIFKLLGIPVYPGKDWRGERKTIRMPWKLYYFNIYVLVNNVNSRSDVHVHTVDTTDKLMVFQKGLEQHISQEIPAKSLTPITSKLIKNLYPHYMMFHFGRLLLPHN